jgi:O-antigen ligase
LKKLLIINENLADKITYYHLALFLISLPFDSLYSRVILLSLAIHTAIHVKRPQLKKLKDKNVYFLTGLYFVSLIGASYTMNSNEALFDLTKELGILIFPIIFALTTLDVAKYKDRLLAFFSFSCLGTVIFLYANTWQVIHFYQLPLSFLFSNSFLNHHFSEPIQLHATYFSMYIGICIFFLLERFIVQNIFFRKAILLLFILILLSGLIQLASRSVFIAVILTVCIAFPLFSFKRGSRSIFLIASVLFLAGIITIVLNNDSFKMRYINEFKNDLDLASANEGRIVRWDAIGELIKKKPIFGFGTGSETQVLKEKYLDKKLYTAYLFGLNTHNQFLGFLLRAGILGLLAYLFTLVYGFYQAIVHRDVLFVGFMTIVTITSLSENILDVNKGIFFYSFFFSFFMFSNCKPAPKESG